MWLTLKHPVHDPAINKLRFCRFWFLGLTALTGSGEFKAALRNQKSTSSHCLYVWTSAGLLI